MATHSGQSTSIWMQTTRPSYPKLAEDAKPDVCVVGAGIAGMTTAYLLAEEGKSTSCVSSLDGIAPDAAGGSSNKWPGNPRAGSGCG
jgi:ribulose 1,5-bisphosphate synthetase/thiazole synthase